MKANAGSSSSDTWTLRIASMFVRLRATSGRAASRSAAGNATPATCCAAATVSAVTPWAGAGVCSAVTRAGAAGPATDRRGDAGENGAAAVAVRARITTGLRHARHDPSHQPVNSGERSDAAHRSGAGIEGVPASDGVRGLGTKSPDQNWIAGYGNRTRLAGLGSQSITTMLSPQLVQR